MTEIVDTHRIDAGACLKCHAPMTASTSVDGTSAPEPGDVTVCLYCGHLMEFGADLKLIEPSDETIVSFVGNPDLLKAMRITGQWRAEHEAERERKEPSQ